MAKSGLSVDVESRVITEEKSLFGTVLVLNDF